MEAQLSEIVNNIRILVDSDESSEDLIYLRQQKWLFEGILKKGHTKNRLQIVIKK